MNPAGCKALQRVPLVGMWYRALQLHHLVTALQTNHTRNIPSRYNAGRNQFEVLYLAENQRVALHEVGALLGAGTDLQDMANSGGGSWAALEIQLRLHSVVDLTQPDAQVCLATNPQELTGDWRQYHYKTRRNVHAVPSPVGIAPTQELGMALYLESDIEGFLTLSAKIPSCRILVVFPDQLRPGSEIRFEHPETDSIHVIPELNKDGDIEI